MENSPLGRLPAEVRLMIYKSLLVEHNTTLILLDCGDVACPKYSDGTAGIFDALHLRATCQLIRKENNALFFSINHLTINTIWAEHYLRQTSYVQRAADLKKTCAEVANWAHWFGNPVLRPKSVTLNLGHFDNADAMGWDAVGAAACKFFREVPVWLTVSVVPYDAPYDFIPEVSTKFPSITFELGERERATRIVNRLTVWYDEKRERKDEVPSQIEVDRLIESVKYWISIMPDRG